MRLFLAILFYIVAFKFNFLFTSIRKLLYLPASSKGVIYAKSARTI